jgi:hypothetical protein
MAAAVWVPAALRTAVGVPRGTDELQTCGMHVWVQVGVIGHSCMLLGPPGHVLCCVAGGRQGPDCVCMCVLGSGHCRSLSVSLKHASTASAVLRAGQQSQGPSTQGQCLLGHQNTHHKAPPWLDSKVALQALGRALLAGAAQVLGWWPRWRQP